MKKNEGVYIHTVVYVRNRRCVINENEKRKKKYYNMI